MKELEPSLGAKCLIVTYAASVWILRKRIIYPSLLNRVWPSAFGGDSSFDNLLGACQSCNNHKSDTPSWAMYPVQALVVGFEIEGTEVLPKDIRFAVQARAAVTLARDSDVSLREAFVQLGRPGFPSIRNINTAVDVFNLQFANP